VEIGGEEHWSQEWHSPRGNCDVPGTKKAGKSFVPKNKLRRPVFLLSLEWAPANLSAAYREERTVRGKGGSHTGTALLGYGGGSEGKGANDSKTGVNFITSPCSLFKSNMFTESESGSGLAFQVDPDPNQDPDFDEQKLERIMLKKLPLF
jgi:hypothetical protein